MKKTRLIALTLILAIMLMGAGYAYWSDQLVNANNVDTGVFNVEFICQCFMIPDISIMDINEPLYGKIYAQQPEIEQTNSKLITIRIHDLYPGTGVYYIVMFKNTGTIPAVYDFAEIIPTPGSNMDLIEHLAYKARFAHYDKNNQKTVEGSINPLIPQDNLNNLPAGLDYLFTKNGSIRLEPGEFVKLEMEIWLPWYVENEDEVENKTAQFDIDLNFTQHNLGASIPLDR